MCCAGQPSHHELWPGDQVVGHHEGLVMSCTCLYTSSREGRQAWGSERDARLATTQAGGVAVVAAPFVNREALLPVFALMIETLGVSWNTACLDQDLPPSV